MYHLEAGINVFVSDVDSVWLKHRDLRQLPLNVDIFHADGYPMPHDIATKWHNVYEKSFTLASGFAAYRATESSIKFVRLWSNFCSERVVFEGVDHEILKKGQSCDDQILLNHIYAYYLKINWSYLPGFTGIYGKVRPHHENKAKFSLNIMVFDPLKVVKGGQPYNCNLARVHKPWILSPRNIHRGATNQLGMFYVYRDCMLRSDYMIELKEEWNILFKLNNITSGTGLRLDYRPSFFESIDLHRNVTYIRSRIVRNANDELVEKIESEKEWIIRRNSDIQKNIIEKRGSVFM